MGNKSKICNCIFESTINAIDDNQNITVFDPFSGTTNVSRYFKKHGINIICNDINDLSYVLAKCYIECTEIPRFEKLFSDEDFLKKLNVAKSSIEYNFDDMTERLINDNKNTTDNLFMQNIKNSNYLQLLVYLTYYASECDWGQSYTPYFLIQRNYCENGNHANYLNQVHKKTIVNLKKCFSGQSTETKLIDKFLKYPHSVAHLKKLSLILEDSKRDKEKELVDSLLKKNLVGKRKFFSEEHGKRFDIILNLINYWYSKSLITDIEIYVLLTAVLESIAIFSNTSATYQAFYKDYKANTMQRFRLVVPEIDETKISSRIYQEDILALIPKVEADVLYLDPPYNWRQYDSNYHLLNTIARFHKIEDWQKFEKGIVGASGENRENKLNYTSFNTKKGFEKLIMNIIENAQCDIIVLSYSDSKSNHERDEINTTLDILKNFFENRNIFEYYYMKSIQSVNFESRKGNKKNGINELLFVAKKKRERFSLMSEQYTEYLQDNMWSFIDKLDEMESDQEYQRFIDFLNSDEFRSFGEGLTYLICQKDKGAKITAKNLEMYLKEKCEVNGIELSDIGSRNTFKGWFNGVRPDKKSENREKMFALAFALNLNIDEVKYLFHKVYLDRAFDCRNYKEAVYYYCIVNGYDYKKAQEIILAIENNEGKESGKKRHTLSISREIENVKNDEDLIEWVCKRWNNFQFNNDTAIRSFNELFEKAKIEAIEEYDSGIDKTEYISKESTAFLYYVILGQFPEKNDDKKFNSVFNKNSNINKEIRTNFPSVSGFCDIERRFVASSDDKDYDALRKSIILLKFYTFFRAARKVLLQIDTENSAEYERMQTKYQDAFLEELNDLLLECGMSELYVANPYDLLFLTCMCAYNPIDALRGVILEIEYSDEESIVDMSYKK